MNKVIGCIILFVCYSIGYSQNNPAGQDTIRNYYETNQATQQDTIKEYWPEQQPQPQQQPDHIAKQPHKMRPNHAPRPAWQDSLFKKLYFAANFTISGYAINGGSALYYDLSPQVGYKINSIFSAGVQVIYNNTIISYGNQSASYSVIGPGVFARALLFKFFFLQAEYDVLSVPANYLGNAVIERRLTDEKMVGIGFLNRYGPKFAYYINLMFDFNPTIYSPYYGSPLVYRAGLSYNF